jgi:hypothetical protein
MFKKCLVVSLCAFPFLMRGMDDSAQAAWRNFKEYTDTKKLAQHIQRELIPVLPEKQKATLQDPEDIASFSLVAAPYFAATYVKGYDQGHGEGFKAGRLAVPSNKKSKIWPYLKGFSVFGIGSIAGYGLKWWMNKK